MVYKMKVRARNRKRKRIRDHSKTDFGEKYDQDNREVWNDSEQDTQDIGTHMALSY